jgi:hypothetical protein
MRTLKDGLRACFEMLRQIRERRQRLRQKAAAGGKEAPAAGDGINLLSYSHSNPDLTQLQPQSGGKSEPQTQPSGSGLLVTPPPNLHALPSSSGNEEPVAASVVAEKEAALSGNG